MLSGSLTARIGKFDKSIFGKRVSKSPASASDREDSPEKARARPAGIGPPGPWKALALPWRSFFLRWHFRKRLPTPFAARLLAAVSRCPSCRARSIARLDDRRAACKRPARARAKASALSDAVFGAMHALGQSHYLIHLFLVSFQGGEVVS